MEPLLSIAELAAILQMPYAVLLYWRVAPEPFGPEHVRVDGRIMFRPADVHSWLGGLLEIFESLKASEDLTGQLDGAELGQVDGEIGRLAG